jgi:hypothetical protein
MSLDASLRAAVGAELAPVLEELRQVRAELEQLRQASTPPAMLPLGKILAISPRAALGRLDRDPALRALGLRLGRRLLFRPEEVRSLLAQRQRERDGAR